MTAEPARILVVEQDPSLAEELSAQLQSLGYVVAGHADTADEALELAARHSPDLALIEVAIPGTRDGIDAAALLRARHRLPVIYLTSSPDAETLSRAKSTDPYGFLVKPVEASALRTAIEVALHRAELDGRLHEDRLAALGTLAAGVAHEINNPLSFVLGNLQYALGELESLEALYDEAAFDRDRASSRVHEICAALADAQTGAERIRRIVSELRRLSRPTAEERERLDLRQVVDAALALTIAELSERARVIRAFDECPPVFADDTRLTQVFVNLLLNAVHAIVPGNPERNAVRVTTGTDERGNPYAEVSDTGSGISNEVIARIFEPFFTTRPLHLGSGLGLPISHAIVSSLGGSIQVDSRVGDGSTFRVVLPPAPKEAARRVPSVGGAEATRMRLLVVDDERFLLDTIVRALSEHYAVETAHGGRQALDLLESGRRFDAILCDLLMPDLTGMDLYAEMELRFPDQAARTVFMTGGAFTPSAQRFLANARHRVLEKPFTPRELLSYLSRALPRRTDE